MSSDPVITVRGLSKRYSIRTKSSLRRAAANLLTTRPDTSQSASFYALKDVSFSVDRNEGLAIMGRNGSGKTTLLQLLANVMSPTSGTIEVNGSFSAMLGATPGMMPTMTGLENILLMAAMYGIDLQNDQGLLNRILTFADIGEFVNTYVKNYSSGMKARIGFSVAIHVVPEIVFIDEVLRVGDVHFREKCDERIKALRAQGKTFVIVTQNAKSVSDICERAIWLDRGEIVLDDRLEAVWDEYRTFRKGQP